MSTSLFLNSFFVIFLAALPGRTTFVVLLMASRGHAWATFLGAALAFLVQCLISVILGTVFSFLTPVVLQVVVGLLLLYFAFVFWKDSRKADEIAVPRNHRPLRSAFLLVFAAEWGDVSQVAIASFSARHPERMTVFLSATLALWLIAGMAIIAGSHIHRVVRPALVQKLAAFGFGIAGLYLLTKQLSI